MYKTTAEALDFARRFIAMDRPAGVTVALAAPFTQLAALKKELEGTGVKLAAQNMHYEEEGAFTGEISAGMLREIGVDYCIIGHSERRQYFGETDDTVNLKMIKALSAGILPICCVGESLEIRELGKASDHVERQVKAAFKSITAENALHITIAYEPIWAIGTGRTATPGQAGEMCALIRETLKELYGQAVSDEIIIQYGGSVKPANASELMHTADIDGALVGGASLDPEDFMDIVQF